MHPIGTLFIAAVLTSLFGACSIYELKVDTGFSDPVVEIVQNKCVKCHSGSGASAGLYYILDSDSLIANGYIVPGSSSDSLFYQKLTSAPPYGNRMPKDGNYLSASELETIASWIDSQEASESIDDNSEILAEFRTVSFSQDIVPLLSSPLSDGTNTNGAACINCHYSGYQSNFYVMSPDEATVDYNSVVSNGAHDRVVPGSPETSWLCQKVKEHRSSTYTGQRMPKDNSVKMTNDQVNQICHWIKQGALNN